MRKARILHRRERTDCQLPADELIEHTLPVEPVKFLTVRNLITPTPRRTYDDVSVNSLQCGQACHRSAAPALLPIIVTVRRTPWPTLATDQTRMYKYGDSWN